MIKKWDIPDSLALTSMVQVALYVYFVRQVGKHDRCLKHWFSTGGSQKGKYNAKCK